ncbi:unnamed protein product [Dicrocoelium dendriticum]|nr:unnamed protein product [Dicrocoelium dendriticum]
MKTPCTDILRCPEFSDVYPPSEDSFLFLDALEKDVLFLKSLDPAISLDIGSGSGIIGAFLHSLGVSRFHVATDISRFACLASIRVLMSNIHEETTVAFDAIQCTLAIPFLGRLDSSVDLIMFNPPYVPTPIDEHRSVGCSIRATWSGGNCGREVIDEFLPQAVRLLSPSGCLYLLLSDANIPTEVHAAIKKLSGDQLSPTTILRRDSFGEALGVYRYS